MTRMISICHDYVILFIPSSSFFLILIVHIEIDKKLLCSQHVKINNHMKKVH